MPLLFVLKKWLCERRLAASQSYLLSVNKEMQKNDHNSLQNTGIQSSVEIYI